MRELKFRAFDKIQRYNKGMFPVYSFTDGYVYRMRPDGTTSRMDRHECEIMQYTGMNDKNGVEIFEGDIVRETRRPPAKDELYTVEYRDEVGAFMFKDQYNDYDPYIDMGEIEVVGNIFEHPELMNNKNKIKEVK
jgi:uncharacterized phage protein (TIGR01671 family)